MQDLDDPFYDFNHDAVFFETIKTFKPKSTFERELVKGVLWRHGKVAAKSKQNQDFDLKHSQNDSNQTYRFKSFESASLKEILM